jgi:hypothetical protein
MAGQARVVVVVMVSNHQLEQFLQGSRNWENCSAFRRYPFFEKLESVFRKISKNILLHNLYFLTIVFGSKRPLLRYNMTIDYECKNISIKY